jgi:hypothetical protein
MKPGNNLILKKLILFLALIVFSQSMIYSQGCLPEGIIFETQEQIDNFQVNYPNCTEIEGDVSIGNFEYNGITNVDGLSSITSIAGDVYIHYNLALIHLYGLMNLTTIGGKLEVKNNSDLIDFQGLNALTTIGDLFQIELNESLINLQGLNNLNSIGTHLSISLNNSISSLSGIENLEANSIQTLWIYSNPNLSDCDVESICNYVGGGSGFYLISDNAPGCNSGVQINLACSTTSIEEIFSEEEITLFPNPATSFITINVSHGQPIEQAIIYNHLGQKVILVKRVNNTVDISGLKSGMYFIQVATKDWRGTTKFIKQ